MGGVGARQGLGQSDIYLLSFLSFEFTSSLPAIKYQLPWLLTAKVNECPIEGA